MQDASVSYLQVIRVFPAISYTTHLPIHISRFRQPQRQFFTAMPSIKPANAAPTPRLKCSNTLPISYTSLNASLVEEILACPQPSHVEVTLLRYLWERHGQPDV